ncbi:MAG: hypothetical protein V7K89_24800 [Nostoc sp.]
MLLRYSGFYIFPTVADGWVHGLLLFLFTFIIQPQNRHIHNNISNNWN